MVTLQISRSNQNRLIRMGLSLKPIRGFAYGDVKNAALVTGRRLLYRVLLSELSGNCLAAPYLLTHVSQPL